MKEIIYIQAGELSNYTGTHFWNTQESYFTYGDDEDPLTSHDISFREGLSSKGEPTLCPRLLAFDRKANFGTLSRTNALLASQEVQPVDEDVPILWNGDVTEYRQDLIASSAYQTRMEEQSDDLSPGSDSNNRLSQPMDQATGNVRYWSDFNRVYYIPRTIQRLPDPSEWESPEGGWLKGQETFSRYNEDAELMEGSLRLLLEECDSIQGIQVVNDTETFGAFTSSLLTSIRDEFIKLPSLVFPLLSSTTSQKIDVDDYQGTRKAINDALYLRSMTELSSLTIPIQSPSNWSNKAWNQALSPERNSLYHQSAILSAHIETATLPLRLKNTREDLASLSAQLNWRETTPFGELSGVFPATFPSTLGRDITNFSAPQGSKDAQQFARRDVTRGFSLSGIAEYDRWSGSLSSPPDSFVLRFHTASYPLPTSFPHFFRTLESTTPAARDHASAAARTANLNLPSAQMLSSVAVADATACLFFEQAKFVENCTRTRSSAVISTGIDIDDLKGLANDLWVIYDNFAEGTSEDKGNDVSLGEDEE
ncbi:mtDNA inheritance protein Dml1 [Crucibulum laeve]|uniref:MtDNA inheritance protein Dml1 n=1 Tax=Crucibulum laeve TaxID=68775 RepID=A0A5C3LZC5_9AGAR|nr:mtDNA inheritance protein Dml1 [Crucibulum laeve]